MTQRTVTRLPRPDCTARNFWDTGLSPPMKALCEQPARVRCSTVSCAASYSGGLIRRTEFPDIQREPLPKRMVEYSDISILKLLRTEFVRGSIWMIGSARAGGCVRL